MELNERKILFATTFLKLQDEQIISNLEKLLYKEISNKYGDNVSPMSVDDLKNDINKAINDSENERVINADLLKSKYAK